MVITGTAVIIIGTMLAAANLSDAVSLPVISTGLLVMFAGGFCGLFGRD